MRKFIITLAALAALVGSYAVPAGADPVVVVHHGDHGMMHHHHHHHHHDKTVIIKH